MALDAAPLLGATQLAGVKVNPKGYGKSTGARSAGVGAGGLIGAAISAGASMKADKQRAQAAAVTQAPDFGRLAYLAVTADELALIKVKGALTVKLDEVITRVPRSEVASAQLGDARVYSPSLTITFNGGETWLLEVPRPSKKDAQKVVDALAG
jgi:hypothetical protein